jgi:small subunit ribosomal protein S15
MGKTETCNLLNNVIQSLSLVIIFMLSAKTKQTIIEKHRIHAKDTGSPEVQVAVLSKEIDELAKHLKTHKKDNHSRRDLLKMVAERRAHLRFLEKKDKSRLEAISKKLSLGKEGKKGSK